MKTNSTPDGKPTDLKSVYGRLRDMKKHLTQYQGLEEIVETIVPTYSRDVAYLILHGRPEEARIHYDFLIGYVRYCARRRELGREPQYGRNRAI